MCELGRLAYHLSPGTINTTLMPVLVTKYLSGVVLNLLRVDVVEQSVDCNVTSLRVFQRSAKGLNKMVNDVSQLREGSTHDSSRYPTILSILFAPKIDKVDVQAKHLQGGSF